MQMYMASHAVHRVRDPDAVRLRHTFADFDGNTFDAPLRTELECTGLDFDAIVDAGPDRLWARLGHASRLTAEEAASIPEDLLKGCFAAQLLWLACEAGDMCDRIKDSVLSCTYFSEPTAPSLTRFLNDVTTRLRRCPEHEPTYMWGYSELLHLVHVTAPTLHAKYVADGGHYAFRAALHT